MSVKIEFVDVDKIGVRFPYDAEIVAEIRKLQNRKWNPKQNRWEIHIAHLADVMRLFHCHPRDIPPEIIQEYQANWIKSKIAVRVTHHTTYISGAKIPFAELDERASFFVPGHRFSPRFLERKWDGKRHLYNRANNSLPSGMLPAALQILDQLKIEYEVDDQRKWPRAKLKIAGSPKSILRPFHSHPCGGPGC